MYSPSRGRNNKKSPRVTRGPHDLGRVAQAARPFCHLLTLSSSVSSLLLLLFFFVTLCQVNSDEWLQSLSPRCLVTCHDVISVCWDKVYSMEGLEVFPGSVVFSSKSKARRVMEVSRNFDFHPFIRKVHHNKTPSTRKSLPYCQANGVIKSIRPCLLFLFSPPPEIGRGALLMSSADSVFCSLYVNRVIASNFSYPVHKTRLSD